MLPVKRLSSAPLVADAAARESTGANTSRRHQRSKSANSLRTRSTEHLKSSSSHHQNSKKKDVNERLISDCDPSFGSHQELCSTTGDSGDYCDSFSTRTVSSHHIHGLRPRCGSASTGYQSALTGDSFGDSRCHSKDELDKEESFHGHFTSEQDLNRVELTAEQKLERSRRRRRRRRLIGDSLLQPSESVPSLAEVSGSGDSDKQRRRRRRVGSSLSSQHKEGEEQTDCNSNNESQTLLQSEDVFETASPQKSPSQSPKSSPSKSPLTSPSKSPLTSPSKSRLSDSSRPPRPESVSSSTTSRRSRHVRPCSACSESRNSVFSSHDCPSSPTSVYSHRSRRSQFSSSSHQQGCSPSVHSDQHRVPHYEHHHHHHHNQQVPYQEPVKSSDQYPVISPTHGYQHPPCPHPDIILHPFHHHHHLDLENPEDFLYNRPSSDPPTPPVQRRNKEKSQKTARHRSSSVPATAVRAGTKERFSTSKDGDPTMKNLSFCGCGFLGMYHLGVAACLVKHGPSFLAKMDKVAGASAGALIAALLVTAPSVKQIETSTDLVYDMAKTIRKKPLGALTPGFRISKELSKTLDTVLPPDAHELANGRLHISVTNVATQKNEVMSQFATRKELIEVLVASCHIPVYSGAQFPTLRGQQYCDGGLTNNMVRFSDGRTVTVSPFSGKQDIGPRDSLKKGKGYFLNLHNQDIQVNFNNFRRMSHAFFPPPSQVLEQYFELGHNDTSRFLIRENMYEIIKPEDTPISYESSV